MSLDLARDSKNSEQMEFGFKVSNLYNTRDPYLQKKDFIIIQIKNQRDILAKKNMANLDIYNLKLKLNSK